MANIKEKTFKIKRYILKVYLKFKKPLKGDKFIY